MLAAFTAVSAAAGATGTAQGQPTDRPGGGPNAAEPVTILALGDSLTAGYGLPRGQGLVPRLEAALNASGPPVRVLDAGVSGDTSAGGRARLAWALSDPSLSGKPPEAAIVALGANDMLRALDPASTRANLDAILAALAERRIPTLLAGMLAQRNLGPEFVTAFEAIYPDLARKHGAILYPFLLDGVAAEAALNQPDGIHPNARGVDELVRRLLPSAQALVGQALARRAA